MRYCCAVIPEHMVRGLTATECSETRYIIEGFFRGRVEIQDVTYKGHSEIYIDSRDWPRPLSEGDYALRLPRGYILQLKSPSHRGVVEAPFPETAYAVVATASPTINKQLLLLL